MRGTSIGRCGTTRLVVATTRTGSPASADSAVRTRWLRESCAVLGATSTSGSSPGGSSISGCGSSNVIGPVTSTPAGQLRGYSSWGKVPTSARSGLMPPWKRSLGASPSLARCLLRSSRPCSSPTFSARCPARQTARPSGVRGGRRPTAKNGRPGSTTG
ncbi:MAG TPA: hypothetical protein VE127_05430 [Solirubrobacteraceae bacterium]|nr:hypothetical protein [Solirubrobacteraceae bacterium]